MTCYSLIQKVLFLFFLCVFFVQYWYADIFFNVLNFDLHSIICECIRLNSTTVHDCGVSNATVCIGHDKHISIGIGCIVCFFPPLLPLWNDLWLCLAGMVSWRGRVLKSHGNRNRRNSTATCWKQTSWSHVFNCTTVNKENTHTNKQTKPTEQLVCCQLQVNYGHSVDKAGWVSPHRWIRFTFSLDGNRHYMSLTSVVDIQVTQNVVDWGRRVQ